ncbi:hypothetical protein MAR_015686 [Mya arenaria]|uniref:C-type lectin domain-containing protein n=1 Tax=Mya arenaria TaxID=6604 RepID=A0ABY7FHV1_MYAAR|nr:hypothetical protein MAR_015686 [Mya arenaria]
MIFTWATIASDFKNSNFEIANFINGEEIFRLILPSLLKCHTYCGDGCGAVRYFRLTGECVLFSEVLLLTDAANVTSSLDAMEYRKISPLENRFQAVFSGGGKSWEDALNFCEHLGYGLATIQDQLDFDALAATINKTLIYEEAAGCSERAWLGGEKEVNVWKWNRREVVEENWPFWGVGQPDHGGRACMRILFMADKWLAVNDHKCTIAMCAFFCE